MYDEHADAIRTMLRRVQLQSLDDSGTQQLANVSGYVGDTPQKIVRLQHAGLSSTPSADAEGLLLAKGGRSGNAWVLGLEHPSHRPTGLPGGATALYDEKGNIIKLIGDSVTFSFDNAGWSVTSKDLSLEAKSGDVTIHSATRVNLGKGANAAVMTTAGPSSKIFAVV